MPPLTLPFHTFTFWVVVRALSIVVTAQLEVTPHDYLSMIVLAPWTSHSVFFSRMASRVLLSTLAIPIPVSLSETEKHLELDENAREKSRRLANLLGLQNIPTRSSLVNDMVWSSLFL